jgi:hypothetical protein
MAVGILNLRRVYKVLAADTKPANPAYYLLYEVDTGLWLAWNGTAWVSYGGDA